MKYRNCHYLLLFRLLSGNIFDSEGHAALGNLSGGDRSVVDGADFCFPAIIGGVLNRGERPLIGPLRYDE